MADISIVTGFLANSVDERLPALLRIGRRNRWQKKITQNPFEDVEVPEVSPHLPKNGFPVWDYNWVKSCQNHNSGGVRNSNPILRSYFPMKR